MVKVVGSQPIRRVTRNAPEMKPAELGISVDKLKNEKIKQASNIFLISIEDFRRPPPEIE